ncbi:MAG: MBL fold metallo-hydrolase [Gammaproteobacteria bacterium]|nr:MAG: MBL fold metallo-hydrolase [Gammaproteobacteria bacterium]
MSKPVSLRFLGAANTVTGSRYLIDTGHTRILVDCGLFQGYKYLRERNWKPLPIDPAKIDAVVLTHAHLDHSGYLPVLVQQGFEGKVYATPATHDLCEILLRDAGKLQEEEADFRNRHQKTRHAPAKPLYTVRDAEIALKRFRTIHFGKPATIGDCEITTHPNGHILGSGSVLVKARGREILFSGDLGRPHDLIMYPPEPPVGCDYLVVESTYGDRLHDHHDLESNMADIISDTARQGGTTLIPSFAVGRAQAMIYLLYKLKQKKRIPNLPVYLDSPMAISATELLVQHHALHRLSKEECHEACSQVHYTRTREESIALSQQQMPCIIISASGMATGGRVLHHLKRLVVDDRNSVVFAGYQAPGTRGARLVNGEQTIRIHGDDFPVHAKIHSLDFLSAHADYEEILKWLEGIPVAPKQTFVTHGDEEAADSFRCKLKQRFGWRACVPDHGETVTLD